MLVLEDLLVFGGINLLEQTSTPSFTNVTEIQFTNAIDAPTLYQISA
jgi:hypothetical protein